MLREKSVLAGKYEILKQIGRGGMSRVWLAMDTNLNKQWAVKEIDKSTSEYIKSVNENKTLTEIEIMKGLDHPYLPRIVDIIDRKESLCVVMDYIEGESLLKILDMYGPLKQELVVSWMIDICEVLSYLHHQSPPIIYRDMKPSNIMLRPDGSIKVIDFGIAREFKEGKEDTVCLGTKGYASPEHFAGRTDARSDIYTVGVSMYQLITGKNPAEPPYEIKSIREVNPLLSSGIDKIIKKATSQNPEERFQSADEMREALMNYKKLEEPYINELKKKIRIFKTLILSAFVLIFAGSSLFAGNIVMENNTYEELLLRENTNINIREDELKKAIYIKPDREDAYLQLIKEYSKEGFDEKEASRFLSIYNMNKEKLDKETSQYANLNFQIGQAFLLFYTGTSDDSSRNRLITARPFFKECDVEGFKERALAKGYCEIADFFTEYIIGDSKLVVIEPDKADYLHIIESCQNSLDNIAEYQGEGAAQMKLVTCDIILSLLDDRRKGFCDQGIEEDTILKLIEKTYDVAFNVKATAEITKEKKGKVMSMKQEMEERVENTYENAKKKESENL